MVAVDERRVVVTGATGLIGRKLVARLNELDYQVVAFVRNVARAKDVLPGVDRIVHYSLRSPQVESAHLAGAAAVVNLAGESLFKPFTGRRTLRRVTDDRIVGTKRLAEACSRARPHPRVFVQASSVGIYGFGPPTDEKVSESSSPLDDEYAAGSRAWEDAATKSLEGVRAVLLRFGFVLATEGGGFRWQLEQARKGKVSYFAPGTQWLPWIHIDDVVAVICDAIEDATWSGPYNIVAPEAATAEGFARALAAEIHAPPPTRSARVFAHLFVGSGAVTLLNGRRVVPQRLLERAYRFRHPDLGSAFQSLCAEGVVGSD